MEQETKVLKLRVYAREIKNGDETFLAFKTVDKKGNKYDLKFLKDCKLRPTESCFIKVKEENLTFDTRKLFPCFWVKEVEEVIALEKETKSYEELFDVA